MATEVLYTLTASAVTSLVSLVGVITIFSKKSTREQFTYMFLAFAVGALIGDAFFHLIPEAAEELGGMGPPLSVTLVCGIFGFYVLERIIHVHHLHVHTEHDKLHPTVVNNLFSDGLHNFVDGIAIAGSFLVSPTLGIATTVAVILHELPQELGDFSILLSKGIPFKKALWFNFLSASAAIMGAAVGLIIFDQIKYILPYILAVIAGGFIYIALADLVPDLHLQKTKSEKNRGLFLQIYHGFNANTVVAIVAGISVMYLLLYLD